MLTLSYFAGEYLDLMLAEADAPDDAVIRLVLEGNKFSLEFSIEISEFSIEIDTVRPGDTTFDHGGKVVLAIDKQTSELLTDMHLDVEVTGEKSQLVLNEQLEE